MARKGLKNFGLAFAGWEETMEKLDNLSHHGVLEGTKKALIETHKTVTPKVEQLMTPHNRTGRTKDSIEKTQRVEVQGTLVSIPVGFDIENGGLPSIWLMHGSPKQTPDLKLYRAIFGHTTSSEVAHVQHQALKETIEKYMGGK
jgi:hypothetical protein